MLVINRVRELISVALLVLLGASFPLSALAAPPTNNGGGQGLEITPPVIQLDGTPGKTSNVRIALRNITTGPLLVTAAVNDFGAKDETGEPAILLQQKDATRFSLKEWVQSIPTATLQPGQQQVFNVPIKVPGNAEPGGHYAVIRFSGTPPEVSGTGVSLSASLGTLVLLRVAGSITEGLTGADFYATHLSRRGTFFEQGPIILTERLHNSGNVHVRPVGSVKVTGLFGKRVADLPININKGNVLPDSTRRFEQTLNQKNLFGRYQASYNVSYGNNHQQLTKSMVFWVVPWRLLLVLLLGGAILLGLVVYGIKRYNRYILASARR